MASLITPPLEDIPAALERILVSTPFAGSHRSQQFLRYVVEHASDDGDAAFKEYTIAIDVFDRDPSYDPAVDATVRVEAGRLRARLREYYTGEGLNDALIIDVPKGGYRAIFSERPNPAKPAEAEVHVSPVSSASQIAEFVSGSPARLQKKSSARLRTVGWALGVTFVLGMVVGWIVLRQRSHLQPVATPQPNEAIRFAVLPFSNETGDTANNYLTDGLTDNLIRQFSEVPRLHVMTRSAVDRVKRADAASALGVSMLFTGNLRRTADGRLVLNSELSSARDGTVVSSRQHLADESDLPSVQADMVHEVIEGLGMELDARQSADAWRPITTSPAAFRAFLRGESEARDPSSQGMHAAMRNYEEAIRQDPQFALAYASLAETHEFLGIYHEPARQHMPLAREYAERALAIDPGLRQAHGALGLVRLVYDWDFPSAENELASAQIRESAMHTLICTSHLHLLGNREHLRHAEEDVRQLLEFDPHSATLIGELGCVSYYAERYADSIRYFREAMATGSRAAFVYWGAGRSLAIAGQYNDALQTLRQFKTLNGFEPPIITAEIGYSEAAAGNRKSALATVEQLQEMSRHTYVDPYLIAVVYLGLKDSKHTYEWLDRAYVSRSPFLISIATDPKWSASHSDPRFQRIWNRMMENGAAASTSHEKASSH